MSQPAGDASGERAALARVLVRADKFRGSLTASPAANALAAGLRAGGISRLRTLPVADGGEGTVDCRLAAGFTELRRRVTGADGRTVLAWIAVRGTLAVIELIDTALDLGCRKLIVGVGGTASTDGGAGLLQALGARLHDGRGAPVAPGGGGLAALAEADLTGLDPRLAGCELLVVTDVDNPLLGSRGAAALPAAEGTAHE